MWTGWGFIDPFFSIFVIKNVAGATLISIGFLATIYWITKGILQIPISLFLDRTDGERDDFYALIFGLMVTAVSAFGFILVKEMWQIYFLQFIKAVGFALYIRHGPQFFPDIWIKSILFLIGQSAAVPSVLGIGLAGFIGGSIASLAGFNFVFLMVGMMGLLSAGLLLFVPDLILPKKTVSEPKLRDHIQMGIK